MTTLPDTTRAAVLEGPEQLVLRSFPLPRIGDDDGLLRVEACGLCGTDHEQWSGHMEAHTPMIPGHESVGIIEAIGTTAKERWGVDVGDRVAVEVFQSCHVCDPCVSGDHRACKSHGLQDPYGQIPVSRTPSIWGGYSEYQYLSPDALVQKVPLDLEVEVAAAFNAVAAGYRWGVTVPETGPGDVVAVMGPGFRGLAAAAAAKEAGAEFVMVTGFGPRDESRLAAAPSFGADLAVDSAVQDPVEALLELTGGRLADVVVDVTANAPAAFMQAIDLAASRGTIVVAGTRGDVDISGFRADPIVIKQLRIQGTLGVESSDYKAAIELLASRRYPFHEVERRMADLDGLSDLLALMAGRTDENPPLFGVLVP